MLAQAQARLALLLVGVHVLQLPARRHVRVAGTHVVRLDGVVRRLQKLPLDIPGSRADVHVNARQILFRNAPNQLVLGHILTFENERAIIITVIWSRPGCCAGIGAVFFFTHNYTSLP